MRLQPEQVLLGQAPVGVQVERRPGAAAHVAEGLCDARDGGALFVEARRARVPQAPQASDEIRARVGIERPEVAS